ncbi:sulfite oxidase [Niallia sp. XMNu-256]|uniref:sulfite oxidase n=1 Tax=Niallia sp. XMNu-256 TaxID=3082444 RepID=UPI0030CDC0B3
MNRKQNIPFLTTRSLHPENQESPIHFLNEWLTSIKYFYRRNHFSYPLLSQRHFWIHIDGMVHKPRFFHYDEILSMPSKSIIVPLECAGNQRANFKPKVYGEQWEEGAISQGKWTGVPLRDILEKVGFSQNAQEIVFVGADSGKKPGVHENIPYTRSLPLEKAMHPDTLIAFQYNDKPINYKHGYPFRLIVPNWYAMASVKWLNTIKVIDYSYKGPFQTDDYVYYPYKDNDKDKFPVTTLNVNSIIQQPLHLSILNTGVHEINGMAWSGRGRIKELQVSFDKGKSWKNATVHQLSNQDYAWSRWSYIWKVEEKGEYTIYARAKDSSGQIQPHTPFWNRKGYGYNAVARITVKVE